MSSGEAFGELALLENLPRDFTILLKSDTHFGILQKKNFSVILSFF